MTFIRTLLVALVGVLLAAGPAVGETRLAPGSKIAPGFTTASAPTAADRDCSARRLSSEQAGVWTARFVAPADGSVTVGLLGGGGDWDLALFDSAGTMVASSAAFEANEVAQIGLRRGAGVTVQACRVSGGAEQVPVSTAFEEIDFDAVREPGPISLVEAFITQPWQVEALERRGLDVTHDRKPGSVKVALYGDRDREIMVGTGLPFRTVVPDMQAAERAAREADRRYAERVGASPLPSGRTTYRTLEDVQKELKDLTENHAHLVRGFTLKEKTFQGRDLQVIEIAENVHDGDDGQPVLFLNGIHHAREWPATESIMEFAWDLVKNHASDPKLAWILRNVRVMVMPFTNTDGFIVSRNAVHPFDPESDAGYVYTLVTGVVVFGGSAGYKRKNCNPGEEAPNYPCDAAAGVDNNRNYAEGWGGPGASTNPNDQSYRGSGPNSEPETRAVEELALAINSPVLLSMHNVAAKVLRPPGLEADGFAPDEEGLKELGRRIAEPAGYANEYGWQLYDTTGTTKDWVYAATGSYGYTVELGPSNGDFHGNYARHVVDQYLGSSGREGRGLREGFIVSAEWTRNQAYTSRIAGRAPAGRTLRIAKAFQTETSPVCAAVDPLPVNDPLGDRSPQYCTAPGPVQKVDEKLDITMVVPASGNFEWWVNPSTRPFVGAAGGRETYTLTCEQDGNVLQQTEIFVARGETARLDIPCGGVLPLLDGGGAGAGDRPGSRGADGRGGAARGKLRIRFGKVVRGKRRRASIVVIVRGGTLRRARFSLVGRRGRRVLATGKVAKLAGKRRVALKLRRRARLNARAYRIRVTGTHVGAGRYKLAKVVRAKRAKRPRK